MNVPEITKEQLELINEVCGPFEGVFSQCDPIPGDPLFQAALVIEAQKHVDHLIGLGLLKEITGDHKEQIEEQNRKSGRVWRVYSVTPLGRSMFQVAHSTAIN
jgi:hypothetical protein